MPVLSSFFEGIFSSTRTKRLSSKGLRLTAVMDENSLPSPMSQSPERLNPLTLSGSGQYLFKRDNYSLSNIFSPRSKRKDKSSFGESSTPELSDCSDSSTALAIPFGSECLRDSIKNNAKVHLRLLTYSFLTIIFVRFILILSENISSEHLNVCKTTLSLAIASLWVFECFHLMHYLSLRKCEMLTWLFTTFFFGISTVLSCIKSLPLSSSSANFRVEMILFCFVNYVLFYSSMCTESLKFSLFMFVSSVLFSSIGYGLLPESNPFPIGYFFVSLFLTVYFVVVFQIHRSNISKDSSNKVDEMNDIERQIPPFLLQDPEIAAQANKVRHHEDNAKQLRILLSNTAHDLKTPLFSINGTVEIILQNWLAIQAMNDNDTISYDEVSSIAIGSMDMLHDIKYTSSFMLAAINRCQDFAKTAEGVKLCSKHETFELKEILDITVKLVGRSTEGIRGRIKLLPVPTGLCSHIVTDKHWLQENLICLLSNAVKFCPDGDITIRLSIKQSSVDSKGKELLCFEIEDRGVGIPKEKQASLFEAFRQAQTHAGGTGLGLYSLARRIDAINGQYGVCDRRDGLNGAVFWFNIPYRPDRHVVDLHSTKADAISECSDSCTLDVACSSVPASVEPTPSQPLANVRILLADDSLFSLKMTKAMLDKRGFTIMQAANGVEVLNLYKCSGPFDVLLIDLHMPVLDGLETMRRIREIEKSASQDKSYHQIMIGSSANGDESTVDEVIQAGGDAFLLKPFNAEKLVAKLKEFNIEVNE